MLPWASFILVPHAAPVRFPCQEAPVLNSLFLFFSSKFLYSCFIPHIPGPADIRRIERKTRQICFLSFTISLSLSLSRTHTRTHSLTHSHIHTGIQILTVLMRALIPNTVCPQQVCTPLAYTSSLRLHALVA
jgi:hypothetical protein